MPKGKGRRERGEGEREGKGRGEREEGEGRGLAWLRSRRLGGKSIKWGGGDLGGLRNVTHDFTGYGKEAGI